MQQASATKSFTDLGDLERRTIMLLLPVPDLLRFSATSHGHRADLFRLMHGDLSVDLTVSEDSSSADREASFRSFLEAGGAPLIKSLELGVRWHAGPWGSRPGRPWPPLPVLESLTVSCEAWICERVSNLLAEVVAGPVIAAASKLLELHLSFPDGRVNVCDVLERIGGAAISAGGSVTSVSIELPLQASNGTLDIEEGVGLLPCPPFQRLLLEAGTMVVQDAGDPLDFEYYFTNNSAAIHEQRAGGDPSWQRITLNITSAEIRVTDAAPLQQLLDSHPAERLVIQGSPAMLVRFVDNVLAAEQEKAAAMFRRRITS